MSTTIPPSQQKLRVTGELQIDGTGKDKASGLINFIGQSGNSIINLGQIRAFGSYGYYTLLLDPSGSLSGLAVRGNATQGDPEIGGQYDQYSITVSTGTGETKIRKLYVQRDSTQYASTFDGTPLLTVLRPNTGATSILKNPLATLYQNSVKIGETLTVEMGGSSYSGCSVWSYTQPTSTSSSALDNYSSFSMRRNNVDAENIRMFVDGSVSIPLTLTVGTINATTYQNLPEVPSSQLLPLTLDKTNNRVGINNTGPAQALDVVGNGHFTGTLDVGNLSVQNSVIVVGDATFNGVVDARQDLNVNKNLNVLGDSTLFRLGVIDSVSAYKYFSGSSFLVGGNSDPEGVVDGVPGSLYMRSDTGVVYVKTLPPGTTGWKELGSSTDLTPITLDKTNNRVGINQSNPTQTLDVIGTSKFNGALWIQEHNNLEFGAGIAGKNGNAGSMAYQLFSDALDIVGAGTDGYSRKVKIWDKLITGYIETTNIINQGRTESYENACYVLSIRNQGNGDRNDVLQMLVENDVATFKTYSYEPPHTAIPMTFQVCDDTNALIDMLFFDPILKVASFKESVDIDHNLIVRGESSLHGNLFIKAGKAIVLSGGINEHWASGTIQYKRIDDALDIFGAGVSDGNLKVSIYDKLTVNVSTSTPNLNLTAIPNTKTSKILCYDDSTKAVSYADYPQTAVESIVKVTTTNVNLSSTGTLLAQTTTPLSPGTYIVNVRFDQSALPQPGSTVTNEMFVGPVSFSTPWTSSANMSGYFHQYVVQQSNSPAYFPSVSFILSLTVLENICCRVKPASNVQILIGTYLSYTKIG